MFPAEKKGEWEPVKVREKKVRKVSSGADDGINGKPDGDVTMADADAETKVEDIEEETVYEEDPITEEGAVYPLRDGQVVNWTCFLALLTHVYNTLSPPFHTPIMVISQPAWTAQDHEKLTQFFFEKFKTPAFCLMDSALAVCYAYGVPTATVVDVGYGKCDVTAVNDFLVHDLGRSVAVTGCGGEGMTQRLLKLLGSKGFTKDMCEQLKRSNICEILAPGTALPGEDATEEKITNPAAAASTGAISSGAGQRGSIATQGGAPRGPGIDTDVGEEDQDREIKDGEDNEGVLDVASIVVSGKTSEFLAKKEKEKAEKAAAKKAAVDAAAAPKPARLPNSKRLKTTFHYDERRPVEEVNVNGKRSVETDGVQEGGDTKRQRTPESAIDGPPNGMNALPVIRKSRNRDNATFVRKDIEIGIERFKAAEGILEQIADSIHRTILAVPDISKRSELWDSLVILGNGSKIRGTLPPTPPKTPLDKPHNKTHWTFHTLTRDRLPRFQRRHPHHPQHQIPHLPLERHNLHLRAPLQPVHPPRHRRQHAAPAPPLQHASAAPFAPPRRQPPPLRRHHRLQPRPPLHRLLRPALRPPHPPHPQPTLAVLAPSAPR